MELRQPSPVRDLHLLVGRIDRAADVLLRERHGTSFSRYRMLLGVALLDTPTQRRLAGWLAISEASTSRMIGVLADAGLLTVDRARDPGNRRAVRLTAQGWSLVEACTAELDEAFAAVLDDAGVTANEVMDLTGRLEASVARLSARRDGSSRPGR